MKARWLPPAGAVLAYTLLSLAMLWPLPLYLGRAVPGREFDIWQNTWNLWWVRRCLWEGQGHLFYTDLLFHPNGASLLFHTLSLSNTILALPLTILAGPAAAYGFVALFSFVAGGIGAALLVHEVLGKQAELSPAARWGAAFVGGTIFTFSSYHLAHTLGHLHMLSLEWLPLYVWAMLRAWSRPRLGWVLAAVSFLLLTSWTDWYYCLYALFLSALFLVVQLWGQRRRVREIVRPAGRVVLVVLLGLAILSVQWVPMVIEQARRAEVRLSPAYAILYSADPLAYITPGPGHPLWGRWTQPLYDRYSEGNWAEGVLYQGVLPLSLALVGLWRRWPGRSFWLAALLGFGVLSLGPVLQWAGTIVTVNGQRIFLPYAVLHLVPLMDISRVPARFGLLVTLAVAVLAGVGLARLLQRCLRRERWRLGLSGLAAVAVCAELAWLPYPVTPAHVPAFYRQMAAESAGGALLEIPYVRKTEEHTARMLYQTVHGHPIFGGYISRGDPHIPYEQIPGFRAWQSFSGEREITEPTTAAWQEQALAALNHYGASYVVLERSALFLPRLQAAQILARSMLGPAAEVYRDSETIAYRVPPGQAPFWEMGTGWGPQNWPEGPARLLRGKAAVALLLPQEGRGRICLQMVPQEGEAAVTLEVDGQPRARFTFSAAETTACAATLSLAAGRHEVVLDGGQGAGGWVVALWWVPGKSP